MSLNYFEVGSKDNFVLSNSAMSALNPEEGGSIIKFVNFFANNEEEEEEKKKQSQTNGTLVHKYIENKDKFAVADFVLPTDMMAKLIETIAQYQSDLKAGMFRKEDIDISITSDLKTPDKAAVEKLQITSAFEKLANFLKCTTDEAIALFRKSRIEKNSYISKKELTVLLDIIEGEKNIEIEYLKFLLGSRGKVVLSKEDKTIVDGMCHSLYTHPAVSEMLGLREDDFMEDQWVRYREQPVYWKEVFTHDDDKKTQINCKALLDHLRINHSQKLVQYIDLKSTKSSLYTFQSAFEYYRYYRQQAFYKRAINIWLKAMDPDTNWSEYSISNYIVPVENKGLFLTGIYEVDNAWIWKGSQEAKNLLGRFAWHFRIGEYRYSPEEYNQGLYKPLKFKAPEAA